MITEIRPKEKKVDFTLGVPGVVPEENYISHVYLMTMDYQDTHSLLMAHVQKTLNQAEVK